MKFDVGLLQTLRDADSIVVLTGAGVSAESGVPTFRDALTGLWEKYDPEQLATPEAFERDPELVTRWYDDRRCTVARCQPNAGHRALAELQNLTSSRGRRFTLVTQNVDRLHQRAGSTDVIELHGSLWIWRCVNCENETEERGGPFDDYPPTCMCGGLKRPGVVWFNEPLPAEPILSAEQAARNCSIFLSLGTSSVVYPAAGLIDVALQRGAKVLEINPQETPYTRRMTWSIRGKTGDILPILVAAMV